MVNSLQNAGKVFFNYFEYLGKLLQSGKTWESFYNQGKLSFICLLGKVLEVQGVLGLCEFHYCEFHYCGFSKLLLEFG